MRPSAMIAVYAVVALLSAMVFTAVAVILSIVGQVPFRAASAATERLGDRLPQPLSPIPTVAALAVVAVAYLAVFLLAWDGPIASWSGLPSLDAMSGAAAVLSGLSALAVSNWVLTAVMMRATRRRGTPVPPPCPLDGDGRA
jgi:hypothetical protein